MNGLEAARLTAAVAAGTGAGAGVGAAAATGGGGGTPAAPTHRVALSWAVHRHWPVVQVTPL